MIPRVESKDVLNVFSEIHLCAKTAQVVSLESSNLVLIMFIVFLSTNVISDLQPNLIGTIWIRNHLIKHVFNAQIAFKDVSNVTQVQMSSKRIMVLSPAVNATQVYN